MVLRITAILFLILTMVNSSAQTSSEQILSELQSRVDSIQKNIDRWDGVEDQKIELGQDQRNRGAEQSYFKLPDQIQWNIRNDASVPDIQKAKMLRKLIAVMLDIKEENARRYPAYRSFFEAMLQTQLLVEGDEILLFMKNHYREMMKVIPFFEYKPFASAFLEWVAQREPRLLMQGFSEFEYQPYAAQIIQLAISEDPEYVRNYLSTFSSVYYHIKKSVDPLSMAIKNIQAEFGSGSRAFLLAHQVAEGKLSPAEAHEICSDDSLCFEYLLTLKSNNIAKGKYSIDKELEQLCLKKVRLVNELHDETRDEVRFAVVDSMSIAGLYACMVYTEDEIFTSTFLGMFRKMQRKLEKISPYQFLSEISWFKSRTFLKMCAGYGVLDTFLHHLTALERPLFISRIAYGLNEETDVIRECASICDIFGSFQLEQDKQTLSNAVTRQMSQNPQKAISMTLELMDWVRDTTLKTWPSQAVEIPTRWLFSNKKHIQQHFFYNDPDGKSSFASFVQTFQSSNWKIEYFKHYIRVSSTSGKKIELYANKPESEYDGHDAIDKYFRQSKLAPEVVVHRGHSFYANTSIEAVMPSTRLAILGSCGGYRNVSQVLQYAPSTYIVSTRQIGSAYINDALIFSICEHLRKGEALNWEIIWGELRKKVAGNSVQKGRFSEYIAPHQNLGAIYLRHYNELY